MERSVFILIVAVIMFITSVTITPFIIQSQIDNATVHRDKQFKIILDSLASKSNEHKDISTQINELKGLLNGSK